MTLISQYTYSFYFEGLTPFQFDTSIKTMNEWYQNIVIISK